VSYPAAEPAPLAALPANAAALERARRAVAALPANGRAIVAVDGIDGAGKTTFADLLAPTLDRPAVRASVDDFHRPRAERHRRGRDSPEGFYADSFDLAALTDLLLEPFAAGGPFRRRAFDHRADTRVLGADEHAPADAVLVLDGLFLHRPELRDRWDLSILVDTPPAVAAEWLRARDGAAPSERYTRGQELYFADCDPRSRATLVLDW
jgi:uridine kinase